jgi:hypothetical protein
MLHIAVAKSWRVELPNSGKPVGPCKLAGRRLQGRAIQEQPSVQVVLRALDTWHAIQSSENQRKKAWS